MPIKKSTAFTASDGSLCATLEEAQRHELALVWIGKATALDDDARNKAVEFAHMVHNNADAILDILTTGPRSKPSARKSKGTSNPKRALGRALSKCLDDGAKPVSGEQARAGFKAMRTAADNEPAPMVTT